MIEEENMKRFVIVILAVALIFGISIGNASAANGLKEGQVGMSVDVNNDFILSGRYFLMKDLAVIGQFGFGINGNDGDGSDIGIGVGIRKYLTTTEDLAPFVGGTIFYSSTEEGLNQVDQKDLSILA